ncbi:MAG: hypothetical protein ACT4PT_10120 [Methanobacteriota archaeon]
MRLDLSVFVPGVDAPAAIAWWTDFREGVDDHPFLVPGDRRILRQTATECEMEDKVRMFGLTLWRERTIAWTGERAVRFAGSNRASDFEGSYAFDPEPGGTRIRLVARVRLRRGFGWTERVAARLARAIVRWDLETHAEEMRRDLAGPRGPSP